mgnify:FL=1
MKKKLLSANQRQFEDDAAAWGYDVFQYSDGDTTCPGITVDYIQDFKTSANFYTDNMGHGFVLYARN